MPRDRVTTCGEESSISASHFFPPSGSTQQSQSTEPLQARKSGTEEHVHSGRTRTTAVQACSGRLEGATEL